VRILIRCCWLASYVWSAVWLVLFWLVFIFMVQRSVPNGPLSLPTFSDVTVCAWAAICLVNLAAGYFFTRGFTAFLVTLRPSSRPSSRPCRRRVRIRS
jgi:hypothetical protein